MCKTYELSDGDGERKVSREEEEENRADFVQPWESWQFKSICYTPLEHSIGASINSSVLTDVT